MKKILFSAIALAVSLAGYAQWKPAGDKIKTTWAEQIDSPEYIAGNTFRSFPGVVKAASETHSL